MRAKGILARICLKKAAYRCRYRQLACRKSEILWAIVSETCIHLDYLTSWSFRRYCKRAYHTSPCSVPEKRSSYCDESDLTSCALV